MLIEEQNQRLDRTAHPQRVHRPVRRDVRRKMNTKLSVAMLLVAASTASADLIFDNGIGSNANNGQGAYSVDDFTLTTLTTINLIHWIGVYGYDSGDPPQYIIPADDDAVIQIFADSGSEPGMTPLYEYSVTDVSRTSAGTMSGWAAFEWSAEIPDTTLAPGMYFVGVYNVVPAPWHWGYSDQFGGESYYRYAEDLDWESSTSDYRFSLYGNVVPEPSSLMLLILGVIGCGLINRAANKGLLRTGDPRTARQSAEP